MGFVHARRWFELRERRVLDHCSLQKDRNFPQRRGSIAPLVCQCRGVCDAPSIPTEVTHSVLDVRTMKHGADARIYWDDQRIITKAEARRNTQNTNEVRVKQLSLTSVLSGGTTNNSRASSGWVQVSVNLVYPWPGEPPSRSRSLPAGWLGRAGHDTIGYGGHRWKSDHINIGRPEIVRLSSKGLDTTPPHPVYWPSSPGSI